MIIQKQCEMNVVSGFYSIMISGFGFSDATFASIRIVGDANRVFDIRRFCK